MWCIRFSLALSTIRNEYLVQNSKEVEKVQRRACSVGSLYDHEFVLLKCKDLRPRQWINQLTESILVSDWERHSPVLVEDREPLCGKGRESPLPTSNPGLQGQ